MNVRMTVFKCKPEHLVANPIYDWLKAGDWVVTIDRLPTYCFDTWEEAMEYAIALKTFINVNF